MFLMFLTFFLYFWSLFWTLFHYKNVSLKCITQCTISMISYVVCYFPSLPFNYALKMGNELVKKQATIFEGSHFQNAWTNFHDFRHTSTPFYRDNICWFHIQQIHNTKWYHLTKVNISDRYSFRRTLKRMEFNSLFNRLVWTNCWIKSTASWQ